MLPVVLRFWGRCFRFVPLALVVFGGCTCSSRPAEPEATAAAPTTGIALKGSAPAAEATPTIQTPTPPLPEATRAPTADGQEADAARRAVCEQYVTVLAGRKPLSDELLADSDFKALAVRWHDLVVCGAVASDSDTLCKRLMPTEQGPGAMCTHMQGIFHELRTFPKGRSYMFAEMDWRECAALPSLPRFCDDLRAALRSGDERKCAALGDLQSVCRAFLRADKSLCRVTGKLRDMTAKSKYLEKEPVKVATWGEIAKRWCEETIDSRAFLGKGLEELSKSAPERERELGRAALGQQDACDGYRQSALKDCLNPSSAPKN